MVCLFFAPGVGAWANDDFVLHVSVDSLSISTTDKPVRTILEALASRGLVDVQASPALDERVDFHAEGITLRSLLHRLLRQYSYVYIEETGIDRLWVLPRVDGESSTAWRKAADAGAALLRLDLTDSDPEIRQEAVLEASELEEAVATDLLLPMVYDPDEAVREAAFAVLEDIAATDFSELPRPTE